MDKKAMKTNGLIIGILLLFVLSVSISNSLAFENNELQWTEGISGKLQRGETLSYMGYSVKAVAFPPPVESDRYKEVPEESVDPYVGLEISKNGVFQEIVLLGSLESYILPDGELKIMVKELPSGYAGEWLFESYNPWAVVDIESRGYPNLEISIDTDNSEFLPLSDIPVTVTIKNKGTADAVNVDMEVITNLPIRRGELKYQYDRVGKGVSITETFTLTSISNGAGTYPIVANVNGFDVKDIIYSAKTQKSIRISGETVKCLSINKHIAGKIYLKDMAIVSLSVANIGNCDLKNVTIIDTVPANIRIIGNHTLNWITDMTAYREWDYTYLIKPTEPNKNGLVLPSASAKYWYQGHWNTIQSNKPKIIIYGPKIVLSKQVDVSGVTKGGNVKITVTAQNTGSTPTKITIFDNISEDTTLISNVKAYENSHESNDKTRFGYTYRAAECTESIQGIASYEDTLKSTNRYIYWVHGCMASVSGIAAYEDFLEANTKISFSYTVRVKQNESFRLPAVSAQYYELGNKGEQLFTETQGPEITIIHPEEVTVNETPTETPTPEPTVTAVPTPAINESVNNMTNGTGAYNIFSNNEFFLNYLWGNKSFSLLNDSVLETDDEVEVFNESDKPDSVNISDTINISNTTSDSVNNQIARFFSYIKNTIFGGMNETELNQSTANDSNLSLAEYNETQGNETNTTSDSVNNQISRFFSYIKNTIFGGMNETELNQSTANDSNLSLAEYNETQGNETNTTSDSVNNQISRFFSYVKNTIFGGMNETELNQSTANYSNLSLDEKNKIQGNATNASERFAKNLIYGISFITLLITSSLVVYLLFKYLKESRGK